MPGTPRAAASRTLLFALFTVSGFAGLIYESIWSHYLKLFLGHAAYAQTLVLALFMGGMALGAAHRGALRRARAAAAARLRAGGDRHRRARASSSTTCSSRRPTRPTTTWLPVAGGPVLAAAMKWSLAAALILPQSVLLGMTFPLMCGGLLRRHPDRPGEALALLYFTNSLGAAAGVLASGFVLIERLGLPGTMQAAGAINLALAVLVLIVARGPDPQPAPAARTRRGRIRRSALSPVARGGAAHRHRVVHLRDRLDPHVVAGARVGSRTRSN